MAVDGCFVVVGGSYLVLTCVSVCVCVPNPNPNPNPAFGPHWFSRTKCVCVCVCACVRTCVRACVRAHKPRGRAPLTMLHTCFAVRHACFLTCQKRMEYTSGLVHELASPSPISHNAF